jgi:hypothetical protein
VNIAAHQAATAIREMQNAMPHDLSMICAVLAAKINENGVLSDRCRKSVAEQLDEVSDEIDADYSQQMEQA